MLNTIKENEKLLLGGDVLLLKSEGIHLKDWPHTFYTPFRTQEPASIQLTLKRTQKLPRFLSSSKRVFDAGTYWQLYRDAKNYRMEINDSFTQKRDKSAIISSDFSKATLHMKRSHWYTQRVMRPLLEVLTINYLASRKGLLLHGAAIRAGKHGFLFIGESGAGKSTLASFWGSRNGDYSVLGDERVVARREKDGWFLYGTPWPGTNFVVANQRIPLSCIFLIRHGRRNQITSSSPIQLYQTFFTQIFSSFWSKEAMTSIAETCGQLLREVPAYELAFAKHPAITSFIERFFREHH